MATIFTRKNRRGQTVYLINYLLPKSLRRKGKSCRRQLTVGLDPVQARLKLAEVELALSQGKDPLEEIKLGAMTFADLVNLYLEDAAFKDKKASTQRGYRTIIEHDLVPFFGEKPLARINIHDMDDFKRQREKKPVRQKGGMATTSPARVNRCLALLRRIFNFAIKKELVTGNNPVSGVTFSRESKGRERILLIEEEKKLYDSCAKHLSDIIKVALYTGMRSGEIRTLTWEAINLKERTITLKDTKNDQRRVVPIVDTVMAVLKDMPIPLDKSRYVFGNSAGDHYRYANTLSKVFRDACRRAGIKDLRFHDLRHTAITRMGEVGMNPLDVALIAGHKVSINPMMLRYYHPNREYLLEQMKRLDSFYAKIKQMSEKVCDKCVITKII